VLLEPLTKPDAADLLSHLAGPRLIGDRAAERILALAEGNPLFVEEVVAMLIDDGVLPASDDERDRAGLADLEMIAVPQTIHALLAARLDRLQPSERAVIEAASIEGKQFARERLEQLVAGRFDASVVAQLRALVRKDLIQPVGAREDTFAFRHQLIRDAAYDGMPKDVRADLHERLADRLQAASSAAPVVDELLGHHLERAVVLRRELGAPEGSVAGLAARASASLRTAGRRAVLRDDPASARLLERAVALAAETDRTPVLAELADALEEAGDLRRSSTTATSAAKLARAAGDRRTAARAELVALRARCDRALGESDLASFDAAARALLADLEALGDDEGMAVALRLLGEFNVNHFERASAYLERAVLASERSGDPKIATRAVGTLGLITVYGPVPAATAVERCRALRRQFADHRGTSAVLCRHEAVLHAMQGRIDEARALDAEADRIIDDLGNA
jgi:predicted ATPase